MFELVRALVTLEYIVFYIIINNKLSTAQKEQISNQFEDFILKRIGNENYENSKTTLIKTAEILYRE